ncbi:MAG: methyltransferase domain-containing protein [Bdellovibrionales bacterium]
MGTDSTTDKFISIDPEGFFRFGENRIEEKEDGHKLLSNMHRFDGVGPRVQTSIDGVTAIVEAFDAPLIIQSIEKSSNENRLLLEANYGYQFEVSPEVLTIDAWDRFHGYNENQIGFVFSRKAQFQFFDLCSEFSDDSFVIFGKEYFPKNWLDENSDASLTSFWETHYSNQNTPWDLEQPVPALDHILPQLKLNKQRVLVLGCGAGHDAAKIAKSGHIVTAVDFSESAIAKAKKLYGEVERLEFIVADAFRLGEKFHHQFDMIFEHTLYCAIDPTQRNQLVDCWRKYLTSEGHILGLFFVFDRSGGPPFGGSEWEVKSRLEKYFSFRFWTRWRHSAPGRQGIELVVFGQLKHFS